MPPCCRAGCLRILVLCKLQVRVHSICAAHQDGHASRRMQLFILHCSYRLLLQMSSFCKKPCLLFCASIFACLICTVLNFEPAFSLLRAVARQMMAPAPILSCRRCKQAYLVVLIAETVTRFSTWKCLSVLLVTFALGAATSGCHNADVAGIV